MKADSPHWIIVGEPATHAEASALDAFREILPDDGITTAWVNLTFIDDNGRSAEIDILLLTRIGFFVVELKGWHGRISGTSQRWYHGARNVENPWLGTDRKAKRLASLLKDYAPNPNARTQVPWLRALVVLHGEGSTIDVEERGLANVLRLDGYNVKVKKPAPPLRTISEFIGQSTENPHHRIDAVRARAIRGLCKRADFRSTPKVRMVGDFEVAESEPVSEGPDWQDVLVALPALPGVKRRLRLYDVAPKAPASERSRVEHLAQREFQLTYGLKHDGIAVPIDFKKTDDGPALVFEHDEAELPLDAYLAGAGASLSMDQRIGLVRQLGETLRYAHQRHLIHRGLAPGRIWVRPRKDALPRLAIRDWYFGQKDRSTDATSRWTAISRGVTDLFGVANAEDWIYLAPEARHDASDVPGIPLDVYGYGALSYLILTGAAPAQTLVELEKVHAELNCLDPRRAAQGVPDGVAEAIAEATSVRESDRPATIHDLLTQLHAAWDQYRRPDPTAEPTPVADPIDAQTDDVIANRFVVTGRRGEGSSGVALAVQDYESERTERGVILKVARTDGAGRTLKAEAGVLRGLEHRRIVRLLDGPLELDGRAALLLSDAGTETLATRLAKEGRSTLGQLERFGSELLEAMAFLYEKGIFHRDIKPANLGIREDTSTGHPTLVLFDFSLATELVDNVRSGTAGYLDPYLGRGRRSVYDSAAELYAVSATLFEMATGQLPWWGQGGGGPAHADDEPVVEPTSFERVVATPLTALFKKALAPHVTDRFGSVEDLAVAWHEVFTSLDIEDADAAGDDARAGRAELDTPLEQSGLSARALSALSRLEDVVTVGDLLGAHPNRINFQRGLGERYRKEIQARIHKWRERLRATAQAPPSEESAGIERTVEALLDRLTGEVRTVAATMFDLAEEHGPAGSWSAPADISQALGLSRARVHSIVTEAVSEWTAGKDRTLDRVRDEIYQTLADSGRVMTVPELSLALAAQRGSLLDGDARLRSASALVRAAYEMDRRLETPTLELRRRGKDRAPILALQDAEASVASEPFHAAADVLIELATDLGREADQLVGEGLVLNRDAVRALRTIMTDALGGSYELPDHRLLRLAAATSDLAAVSGFEELYPRDLEPLHAVEYALRGKPGRSLSVGAVRRSVAARFPAVQLPEKQTALDEIVSAALPGMTNVDGVYVAPSTFRTSVVASSTTSSSASGEEDEDVAGKLALSFQRRSARTLCVTPKQYVRATRALSDAFAGQGLEVLDVGSLLVRQTRALAEKMGIDWSFVLGVDAASRDSSDWANLERLVAEALAPAWQEQMARPVPLLVTNAGPLVRYGMRHVLAEMLDTGTKRPAARWLLVAQSADQSVPNLEGQAVPVGPSRWITLPTHPDALARLAAHSTAPTATPGAQQ